MTATVIAPLSDRRECRGRQGRRQGGRDATPGRASVTVGRLEVDGVGLYVEVDGPDDGTPVLFLHGVGSSARTWDWLPPAVTQGRRIVRVDQRGHGRSDHATGTYVLARYGADAVAILRELVAGPALIVGHSLGGVVAWWVAQNHPELVTAVLLEDPPLLAAETPEGDAGRFRDVFRTVRATILDHRARGLSEEELEERIATIRWAPGTPPLREVLTDDAISALAFGYHRLEIGVHRRCDRRLDAGLDGHPRARDPAGHDRRCRRCSRRGLLVGRRRAPCVAQDRMHEVVRVIGSGHRIHQSRRHRAAYAEHAAAVPRRPRCEGISVNVDLSIRRSTM